jgi:hypothetical protein
LSEKKSINKKTCSEKYWINVIDTIAKLKGSSDEERLIARS